MVASSFRATNVIVVILLVFSSTLSSDAKDCYAEEDKPYKLFASKTTYDVIREGGEGKRLQYEGCEAKQLVLFGRHGTRYPDAKDIEEMQTRLPQIQAFVVRDDNERGKLCKKDVENLRKWQLAIDASADDSLTPSGERELQQMGARFKARFPELLGEPYSPAKYDVRFTGSDRTNATARNFIIGLFGEAGRTIDFPPSFVDEDLLKFYKKCPKWTQSVDKNDTALEEYFRFRKSDRMKEVRKAVSKRVGMEDQLSRKDVQLMYSMCRFEAAWTRGELSPWCAAFSKDDLKALEYLEDVKYYYNHGYGHAVNYEQACAPVADTVQHFRQVVSGNSSSSSSSPVAALRFSHSSMMLKVLARLGLFADSTPPTADNYEDQKNRRWRTSFIDSFASNVAFALLDCGAGAGGGASGFQVAAFVQERPTALPGCGDRSDKRGGRRGSLLCPWETFVAKYGPIADSCNVAQTCAL